MAVVALFVAKRDFAPRGLHMLLTDWWHHNVIGYDFVYWRRPGGTDTCVRYEPRWKRNALLNRGDDGLVATHALYERVTGWGRTYRLGYNPEQGPHIQWRADIRISPVDDERGRTELLMVSDGFGSRWEITIGNLLETLSVLAITDLSAGVGELLGAYRRAKYRIAELEKRYEQLSDSLERQNVLALQTDNDNWKTIADASYWAWCDLIQRMRSTTRLFRSKEGREFALSITKHRNGVLGLLDKAEQCHRAKQGTRIPVLHQDDVANFRYPQ